MCDEGRGSLSQDLQWMVMGYGELFRSGLLATYIMAVTASVNESTEVKNAQR